MRRLIVLGATDLRKLIQGDTIHGFGFEFTLDGVSREQIKKMIGIEEEPEEPDCDHEWEIIGDHRRKCVECGWREDIEDCCRPIGVEVGHNWLPTDRENEEECRYCGERRKITV
jgi:hypothetical protein